MPTLGIIPARFASTRFPGKPLVDINGKTMIQRVWEQANKAELIDDVIVATDDKKIFDTVITFGGKVEMTSEACKTGTDRCFEIIKNQSKYDIIVNIQGDEPFIDPSQIDIVIKLLKENTDLEIATLSKKISDSEQLFNPNVVKLVKDKKQKALYFSRNPIPFFRNSPKDKWIDLHNYYKHIGLYAYRITTLKEIAKLKQTSLELSESLEQLRWLENGYSIGVGLTTLETMGIDTPEDLENILKQISFD